MPDQRRSSDNRADTEPRSLSQEQDMEVGYEDNPSPLTFEGLERKFINEIMNLAKEQSHTEDVEYARHREVSRLCPNLLLAVIMLHRDL